MTVLEAGRRTRCELSRQPRPSPGPWQPKRGLSSESMVSHRSIGQPHTLVAREAWTPQRSTRGTTGGHLVSTRASLSRLGATLPAPVTSRRGAWVVDPSTPCAPEVTALGSVSVRAGRGRRTRRRGARRRGGARTAHRCGRLGNRPQRDRVAAGLLVGRVDLFVGVPVPPRIGRTRRGAMRGMTSTSPLGGQWLARTTPAAVSTVMGESHRSASGASGVCSWSRSDCLPAPSLTTARSRPPCAAVCRSGSPPTERPSPPTRPGCTLAAPLQVGQGCLP
jgi:hypothetical protein